MSDRHLSWRNLQDIIREGRPARFGVAGVPKVEIIVGEAGAFLGLLSPIDLSLAVPVSPLELVSIEQREIDGQSFLMVSGNCQPLFEELYGFLTGVADSIQLDHQTPADALEAKFEAWKNLLRSAAILTKEQEIGLWGELWLLVRLLRNVGMSALQSWTGPLAEPHDFRLKNVEFEVKTTRRRTRTHTISSLDQLLPSPGNTLYLLSLQLEPTAAGTSLREMIQSARSLLAEDITGTRRFNMMLEQNCGCRDQDAVRYGDAFRFRAEPALIPVDAACPKLTRSYFRTTLPSVERRILDVSYEVDLEGLGFLDGTREFLHILPRD